MQLTWLLLARLGKVGHTGMRAHQHITRVQHPFQKTLLGFRNVNSSERSLGQGVGRNQGQTVHTHLVDAVNGLKGKNSAEHMLPAQDGESWKGTPHHRTLR